MILLLITFFCIFILVFIAYYTTLKKKEKSVEEVFSDIVTNINQNATAFTFKDLGNGKFTNVYVGDDYEILEQDYPITLDGEKYTDNSNLGVITHNENGFTFTGSKQEFTCPSEFKWDSEIGDCVLLPLCKPGEVGFKGLTYHQSVLRNQTFHKKLYVECPSNTILACNRNEVFVGVEGIVKEPCTAIDACTYKSDGSRHIFGSTNNRDYFVCENGKSQPYSCEDSYYDPLYESCVSQSCIEGTQVILDKQTFAICKDGNYIQTFCENGYTEDLICISNDCIKNYPKETNWHDNYVVEIQKCKDNIITTESATFINLVVNIQDVELQPASIPISHFENFKLEKLDISKLEFTYIHKFYTDVCTLQNDADLSNITLRDIIPIPEKTKYLKGTAYDGDLVVKNALITTDKDYIYTSPNPKLYNADGSSLYVSMETEYHVYCGGFLKGTSTPNVYNFWIGKRWSGSKHEIELPESVLPNLKVPEFLEPEDEDPTSSAIKKVYISNYSYMPLPQNDYRIPALSFLEPDDTTANLKCVDFPDKPIEEILTDLFRINEIHAAAIKRQARNVKNIYNQ